MSKYNVVTKELFDKQVRSYIASQESLDLIEKAYNYAFSKHAGQKRASGEDYFVHVLNVGYELAKLKVGPKTIAAGLLHDVIEDCNVDVNEFIEEFGQEIFSLVDGVTKVSNLRYEFKDDKEYQSTNHRKIFMAMSKDLRVIIIKLIDRLHNMRTLGFCSPEKQLRIAKETLEVYAPVAHRLGLAEIKNELEDLSFMYLDNEKYHEIAKLVEDKKTERDMQVQQMIEEITEELKKQNITFRIFGRSKHLYSIHKKMTTKNKRFEEILDLLAIRIITDTKLSCYEILGYIHAKYKPIPGRFKDYIAMPKSNMYQSLHTTVVGIEGKIFEIQIRTEEMDQIAERGVAAHWAYKEGSNYNAAKEQNEIKKELEWLSAFDENENNDEDAINYMDTISNDIFNANVYVLTPKGRVIDLPNGSCPIDFAYRIHTEVGHQTVGSKVNGILVPLNTQLKTGDVVEIMTDKKSGPSEDWIKICKSNNAKNRIRQYLTKKEQERKSEYVKQAEQTYVSELKKRNLDQEEFFDKEKIESIAKSLNCSGYTDVMYNLATHQITVTNIIDRLSKNKRNDYDLDSLSQNLEKTQSKRRNALSKTGVIVNGVDSVKISMSSCCCPVYGDEIVGYVTKGLGVKVHRKNCSKIANIKERLINVSWDTFKDPNVKYETNLKIFCSNRNFLLTDVITMIAQYKATLLNVKSSLNQKDLTCTISVTMMVDDLNYLELLMANLRKINSVISVERINK